jgi:hypothetical protein
MKQVTVLKLSRTVPDGSPSGAQFFQKSLNIGLLICYYAPAVAG